MEGKRERRKQKYWMVGGRKERADEEWKEGKMMDERQGRNTRKNRKMEKNRKVEKGRVG